MEKPIGVYQIICTETRKRYVGATVNLVGRKRQHFSDLRLGKHGNPRLQHDYNLHGESSFHFYVLETLESQEDLLEREQFWIDRILPEYNAELKAGNSTTYTRTPQTRERTRRSVKELWQDPEYREKHCKPRNWKNGIPNRRGAVLSEETKQKLREAMTGEGNPNYGKPRSQSFLDKMQKTYPGAIAPDGTVYAPIVGLKAFCDQHGLDSGQFSKLLSGKVQSCKGWKRV